jgi:hypothetical protein
MAKTDQIRKNELEKLLEDFEKGISALEKLAGIETVQTDGDSENPPNPPINPPH